MATARTRRKRRETALDRLKPAERLYFAEFARDLDHERAVAASGLVQISDEARARIFEAFAELRDTLAKQTGVAPERAQHARVSVEETMTAGVVRGRVTTQTMLDRYSQRRQITGRQYDAGQKLWADWYYGVGGPKVTARYDERMPAGETDWGAPELCRVRYRQAVQAVGIQMSAILIHVVCMDMPANSWGQNRGVHRNAVMPMLCWALDALADFYRLPVEQAGRNVG